LHILKFARYEELRLLSSPLAIIFNMVYNALLCIHTFVWLSLSDP